MAERFVAIGECMVEIAPTAEGTFRMGFAGDTLNTAWYARRALPAGWEVDYLTAVGTDPISDQMVGFFEAGGLRTGHVMRREDSTVGLYLIQLRDGERSFSYWRSAAAARRLAADPARLAAALDRARIAYFSGITLAILPEDERANLQAALQAARARGTNVVFDTNLRPRLFSSIAAMRETITEAARLADIVLPSAEDEALHFGDANPEATADRYADLGAALVVVKNGAGEIVSLEQDRLSRHAPVKAPAVVDTTAAGDSFNAGFLAARARGQPLAAAIQAGAALASKVIGARGALVEV